MRDGNTSYTRGIATRADMCRRPGRAAEARTSYEKALALKFLPVPL